MSVIKTGDKTISVFSNKIKQDYYISTYFSLINNDVFIDYKNPIEINSNTDFYLSHYLTDFGDNSILYRTSPSELTKHKYTSPGTYFITYSAIYLQQYNTSSSLQKINNSISNFNRIILNQSDVPNTTPSLISGDPSYQAAKTNILKYKSNLQSQIVEYAKYHFPTAMNDSAALSAKCYRDMGYVIDAIAADIGNNTNHRSVDLGNMYFQTSLISTPFLDSTVPTLPQSEVEATIQCINALKYYINGTNIPQQPQPFTTTGILSSISDGSERATDIENLISTVTYPLLNNGSLLNYQPNGTPSVTDEKVANLIISNKAKIQTDVASYVSRKNYLTNQTLISKCNRDVGLILDALIYELKTGVMSKSIQYAFTYWEGSTSRLRDTTVPNHRFKTIDTFNQIYNVIQTLLSTQSSDMSFYVYTANTPITIKDKWEVYDQANIRLNDEIKLTLPYNLEQINIQPNEWGVEDIFNTSIYRLQECLDYLINKTQTINTYAPTLFFGWLGNSSGSKTSKIKWHTQSYNSEYINKSELVKNTGVSYFKNVIDFYENEYFMYVVDDYKIRIFQNKADPVEIEFINGDELTNVFLNPTSIAVNELGDIVYIVDKTANTVFKIKLSGESENKATANIQLFVGGFGGLIDNNNFNTPTDVVYKNNNVYVLDYNNFCVKQYNQDLTWMYTYYIPEFKEDRPISISVLDNGLLYVLSENYKVYIFDNFSNILFESFVVSYANDGTKLKKICFSNSNDFVYVLTESDVYKYTLTGYFVTVLSIPKGDQLKYTNIKSGKNETLTIASENCVFKCHDVLQIFKLGGGLPYSYWSKDQLTINKDEFSSDIVYNRSLKRITQNIKSFRDTLNAKFIIATENVQENVITYFSYMPIDLILESPKFLDDIEYETLGVGVNELHLPPVINKELYKIYSALETLTKFLNIENYFVKNSDCLEGFCWSWDATSCYKLKLPVIKTCGINPISYTELYLNNNEIINYAPNVLWKDAISKCCKKIIT